MTEQRIIIKNKHNENLVGIFHKANDKKEVVIVNHGLAGNKNECFIKELCDNLKTSDINAFRFDFSGNGKSEGDYIKSTTTKEISDLKSVVDYFDNKGFTIGLVGHSKGGMDSLIEAAHDKRIKFIISIAGMAYTSRFIERIFPAQKEKILKGEQFYWDEKTCGKRYPMTPEIIKDLESHNPLAEVKKINCPILFVHGAKDKTVLVEESKDLFKEANEPKEIKIFENADHCFTNPTDLKEMIEFTTNFICNIFR